LPVLTGAPVPQKSLASQPVIPRLQRTLARNDKSEFRATANRGEQTWQMIPSPSPTSNPPPSDWRVSICLTVDLRKSL
jgi:hypothetical protein